MAQDQKEEEARVYKELTTLCCDPKGEDVTFLEFAIGRIIYYLKGSQIPVQTLIAVLKGKKPDTDCVPVERQLFTRDMEIEFPKRNAREKPVKIPAFIVVARLFKYGSGLSVEEANKSGKSKEKCCGVEGNDDDPICFNPYHWNYAQESGLVFYKETGERAGEAVQKEPVPGSSATQEAHQVETVAVAVEAKQPQVPNQGATATAGLEVMDDYDFDNPGGYAYLEQVEDVQGNWEEIEKLF